MSESETATQERSAPDYSGQPILEAEGMIKLFGRVVGLRGVDLRLFPGEVLAVIGDNGAGKSTLIKCLSGAMIPDRGTLKVDGQQVSFKSTAEARVAGIETVYQTLAVAPALDIASNLYLAREIRRPGFAGSVLRMLDTKAMRDSRRGAHQEPRHLAPCRTSTSRSRRSPGASGRSSPWPARVPSAARWRSSTSRPPRSAYARRRRCSASSGTCESRASASS